MTVAPAAAEGQDGQGGARDEGDPLLDAGPPRGGRADEGPIRRCIATQARRPRREMIRFVLSPEGALVPDLAARLPGRGVWLSPERAAVERAAKKGLFARAFRRPVVVPVGLAGLLETLASRRLIDAIAMARKAGQAVTGFEKTRAMLASGRAGLLIAASDAAEDGRQKLAAEAGTLPRMALLSAAELGLAFGRDFAIHAALERGGFADRALEEAARLGGLRLPTEDGSPPRPSAATRGFSEAGAPGADGTDDGRSAPVEARGPVSGLRQDD